MPDRPVTSQDLWEALEYFWHPVATVAKLSAAGGVMAVRLLGRDLVVAGLAPGAVAVENFVDLAHFAWVHDGTLDNREHPVPPDVEARRVNAELRFEFVPPAVPPQAATALLGPSRYRCR